MGFLREYYKKLSTKELRVERFEIQNRIEENNGRRTTDGSNNLDYDLDKRDAIDKILATRYKMKGGLMKTIPILTSISIDGTVTIDINQVGYTYQVDAGFLPKIEKLFRYKPWMAVRLLKQKAYHYDKTLYNNLSER
jgi:hypothetical protein